MPITLPPHCVEECSLVDSSLARTSLEKRIEGPYNCAKMVSQGLRFQADPIPNEGPLMSDSNLKICLSKPCKFLRNSDKPTRNFSITFVPILKQRLHGNAAWGSTSQSTSLATAILHRSIVRRSGYITSLSRSPALPP